MLPNWVKIKRNVVYEKVYQDLIGDPKNPKSKLTVGYCDDDTKHLYIKLGLTKDEECEAELHELLHAIGHHYKIKIPHIELDKLSTALYKVMKLNEWID